MWTHERTLKLAMAAGTLGLMLLAPPFPRAPWLVLLCLMLPLGLYLIGHGLVEAGGAAHRVAAGQRAARWAGALYLAWYAVLAWRAVALHAPSWVGGVVLGAAGVLPALDALRWRRG